MNRERLLRRAREIAAGGAASVAVSVAATNVLRIFSSMTLTRLLDADAFGVVGIIMSVSVVIALISDLGLYDFIVQHRDGSDERFLHQVWTIRLVRHAVLTLAMMALSAPIAHLLGKPALAAPIAVWSLHFLIDGFSSLSFATAVRTHQFWRLSLLELIANVLTLIVGVAGALATHSYWAMIAGMLVGAAARSWLSYRMFTDAGRRWQWDFARARELWGFSRYIALSSFLTLLVMQSDKLVLARLIPLAAYGLYAIATTLAAAPTGLAIPYATRVLLAAYADAARESKAAMARIYYARRRKVAIAYMFLCGGLIGGAPLLVAVLYDSRYQAVTPFLRLLLISAALRLSTTAAKWGLIALGYTRSTFYANLASTLWLAGAGAIAIWRHDILALVAVVGLAEVPALLVFWWNLKREHILSLRQEALELGAGGVGALAGYGIATLALALLPNL